MSDPIVLMERYAAFKTRADRLQAAMDAISKAEPDVEMIAMADSLKVKRDRILLDCASIQLEMANLLNDMKGGNRMCIYEICPMMTGGEWPDCKKCPYADGTEGDERMDCTATFSNGAGTIRTGTGDGRGREAYDTLQTSTRVLYSDDHRKVNVTLTPDKARDLIELLVAYIKYKGGRE